MPVVKHCLYLLATECVNPSTHTYIWRNSLYVLKEMQNILKCRTWIGTGGWELPVEAPPVGVRKPGCSDASGLLVRPGAGGGPTGHPCFPRLIINSPASKSIYQCRLLHLDAAFRLRISKLKIKWTLSPWLCCGFYFPFYVASSLDI